MDKKKLSLLLTRVAKQLETQCGSWESPMGGDSCVMDEELMPMMPMPPAEPVSESDFRRDQTGPHGRGAGPGKGKGCGQMMEGDPEFRRDQTGPHGRGAGPGKGEGCGQMMEGDSEILMLRGRVVNVLNKYGCPWDDDLVDELVGLIEQHEVEEFPGHPEPLAHLEGKLESEFLPEDDQEIYEDDIY